MVWRYVVCEEGWCGGMWCVRRDGVEVCGV